MSGRHSQDLSSGSQKQEEEQAETHHQDEAQVGEEGILLEKSKDGYTFAVDPQGIWKYPPFLLLL